MPEAKKKTNGKRESRPFKVGAVAILVIGAGGFVTYKILQGLGLIKDKADRDFEKLRSEPWMITPYKYAFSRLDHTDELCVTKATDWQLALERINAEIDPYIYTNELILLGEIKFFLKSRFDFAYFSYLYQQIYDEDFPSALEYKIDATFDDIAFEHLNTYLVNLPDTTVESCECNSVHQKATRQEIFDQNNGTRSMADIKRGMYCK